MSPTRAAMLSTLFALAFAASACGQATTAPAATTTMITTAKEKPATLSVQGHSELRKPADLVQISIGVVSEAPRAGDALAENSGRMRRIIDAIGKVGLGENEFQTGRFQIRPQYSRRPRQADEDWRPTILGYEVTNTLLLRTTRMHLAAELIEAANDAGANSIDRLQFTLADDRAFRDEAIAVAARHARADALVLAEASGVTLVRPLSITLDGAAPWSPPAPMARAMASSESSAPPLTPGDVTIGATVSIVYEIKPQD